MNLSCQSVVLRRGRQVVVEGLSLQFRQGSVTGLLGPNGAGKTTVMDALAGVLACSGGAVALEEASAVFMVGSREYQKRVGYVPQGFTGLRRFTVNDMVGYAAWLKRVPRVPAVAEAVDRVGLQALKRRMLGDLSGGERQRVAIACGLVGSPRVLLLDEPTEGLDPQQRASFKEVIRDLAMLSGVTVLLSSHLVEDIADLCDQVAVLDRGELAFVGSPEQLCVETLGERPARVGGHELERAYLHLMDRRAN